MPEELPEFDPDAPLEVVRAIFNLPKTELEDLKLLAEKRNKPVTEVLRQAMATELLLQTIVDNGGRIIVETVEGETRELIFQEPN